MTATLSQVDLQGPLLSPRANLRWVGDAVPPGAFRLGDRGQAVGGRRVRRKLPS